MSKWIWRLWIIPAVVLHGLDVLSTYLCLVKGTVIEENPAVVALIDGHGLVGGLLLVLALKFLIIGAGGVVCWVIAEVSGLLRECGIVATPLVLSVLVYLFLGLHLGIAVSVVINNFTVLASVT